MSATPCKALFKKGSTTNPKFEGIVCGAFLEHPWHEITSPDFNHGYEEGDSTMTAPTNTPATTEIDPATLPIITPKAKRAPKGTAPTNIATARATKKRRKLTGEQWKEQRAFAQKTTGYNDTSPIWGKRLIEVLVEIESLLDFGTPHTLTSQKERVEQALLFNRELQKRLATNQLTNINS